MKYLILLLLFTSLYAGPPMKSNDPFVPNLGMFEINLAAEVKHKDTTTTRVPIIDFNYGIFKNIQLTLENSYIYSSVQNDFDSFEIALKWNFYKDDFFSIALYPKHKSYLIESVFGECEAFELSIPMNFSLQQNIDLVVDITYVHPKRSNEYFEFGSYVKYKEDKHIYFVELFMKEHSSQDDSLLLGTVGYVYEFHENLSFMLSFGKKIINSRNKEIVGYNGLQIIF